MACIRAPRGCSYPTKNPYPQRKGVQMNTTQSDVMHGAKCSQCGLDKTCVAVAPEAWSGVYLCYPCVTNSQRVLKIALSQKGLVRT